MEKGEEGEEFLVFGLPTMKTLFLLNHVVISPRSFYTIKIIKMPGIREFFILFMSLRSDPYNSYQQNRLFHTVSLSHL